jgi:hypothetical protein
MLRETALFDVFQCENAIVLDEPRDNGIDAERDTVIQMMMRTMIPCIRVL